MNAPREHMSPADLARQVLEEEARRSQDYAAALRDHADAVERAERMAEAVFGALEDVAFTRLTTGVPLTERDGLRAGYDRMDPEDRALFNGPEDFVDRAAQVLAQARQHGEVTE